MTTSPFNPKRRRLMLGAAGLAGTGLLPAAAALAQSYPNRPITFLCPWPAGGTADATMRVLTKEMARHLGQPVVFENRPGASGMIGSRAIAAAAPDGYTIGQIPISVTRFSQLGTVNFDPLKDFTYLARTSGQTFGIVVRSDAKYKTLADLVKDAKANPGRINYGSAGVAGATHVGMEEFCLAAGIRMNHVPYKGGAPALTDLLGGQLDVLVDSSSWAQYVETGKLRLLATWGAERPPRFKNAPTLKDAGYDVVVDAPNGVGAPAGLPPEVEARLRDALRKAVASAEFRQACEKIDAPVMYQDAADYRKFVLEQYVHEKRLIEKLNLKEQIKNG
ncbi:Tripartite-type tricarboxylate transporter, receptor component TctC [Noviherbaspirillum humi]|uniref:Tripartite-type tricarboxylate transporter, receptor component TctC n=1 Tax=Noviherbaspirillum humi TaxID=1688639 RepID=A0A239EYH3_9BURK|nr:tripartite tricarboxylate transporter substrate binding protein [Noviherbaspirillum humi]SNS49521.1 Tripartite-type tricarboxylate transporter, receptor component TctC [Noviherbaspirillum humi]